MKGAGAAHPATISVRLVETVAKESKHHFDLLSGRFLEARIPLLIAAASLVCISLVTIYAIGHPSTEPDEPVGVGTVSDAAVSNGETADGPQASVSNRYAGDWKRQAA